jgi:hypothetical protein
VPARGGRVRDTRDQHRAFITDKMARHVTTARR